jgi:NADP-dependent aldehyde dehydrogenase
VVKAHEAHPGTSVLTASVIASALASAGAPDGAFGIVYGVEAGPRLLRHPSITAAGFTGSTAGGLALARVCAERDVPIPFFGELGSVNPGVVLPGAASARADQVAAGYVASLTQGAGQFCTNPGLLFVPAAASAEGGALASAEGGAASAEGGALLAAIAAAVTGSSGGPMLSARIFAAFRDAVAVTADQPGVTELAAGRPGEGPWGATPRVFTVALKEFTRVLAREQFGPAGVIVTYPSVTDLLPVLAALPGNLAASLHIDGQDDIGLARELLPVLERIAGRIIVDGWPTGVAVVAAQHHGGPYPATTAPAYTSVGSAAIRRWLVPVAYQNVPAELRPAALR